MNQLFSDNENLMIHAKYFKIFSNDKLFKRNALWSILASRVSIICTLVFSTLLGNFYGTGFGTLYIVDYVRREFKHNPESVLFLSEPQFLAASLMSTALVNSNML